MIKIKSLNFSQSSSKKFRKISFFFLFLIVLIWLYILNSKSIKKVPVFKISESKKFQSITKRSQRTKSILFWTRFFNDLSWYTGGLEEIDETFLNSIKCPATNCFFTHNRNLFNNVTDFDAILFHTPESMNLSTVPNFRSSHQIYTFVSIE